MLFSRLFIYLSLIAINEIISLIIIHNKANSVIYIKFSTYK